MKSCVFFQVKILNRNCAKHTLSMSLEEQKNMLCNISVITSRSFQAGAGITPGMNKTWCQDSRHWIPHSSDSYLHRPVISVSADNLNYNFMLSNSSIIRVYFHPTPTLIATAKTDCAHSFFIFFAAYNNEQKAMNFRASICCQPLPVGLELQRVLSH